MLCDGCSAERSGQGEVAQGVGDAFCRLCLCALLFGDDLLAPGCLRRLYGALLGGQCVLSLYLCLMALSFGVLAFLQCNLRLLLGGQALFVADAAFLVGYLLHLCVDVLHDC